ELLGFREHSVYQLKQKLLQRNFSLNIVEKVLEELILDGSVSNTRFMEIWLSNRLRRHPEGFRALFAGLIRTGISSSEILDYLIPYMETVDSEKLLKAAAGKIMKNRKVTKDKLIKSLGSRGFDTAQIIQYIEQNFSGKDDSATER
ncbi:MAG: recombination regulator RecX, partial [Spirochaetales bacterium]|nr:recombination regulator RecX [Spirochaetales bacterium]